MRPVVNSGQYLLPLECDEALILLKKIPSGGGINKLIVLSTIFHSVKGMPLSKSTFSSGCSQSLFS